MHTATASTVQQGTRHGYECAGSGRPRHTRRDARGAGGRADPAGGGGLIGRMMVDVERTDPLVVGDGVDAAVPGSPTTSGSVRSTATIVRPIEVGGGPPGQLDLQHLGHGASVARAADAEHSCPMTWPVLLGRVAVCGGLLYLAHRIEPHWVAKDGTRFITTAQPIDRTGATVGRAQGGASGDPADGN